MTASVEGTGIRPVQSPCGHGLLVDVVPQGHGDRWGLVSVVQRRDCDEPVECCSFEEGEHRTREEAQRSCDHQKRWFESKLDEALALLDGLERQVGIHVSLDDLIRLRGHLREIRQTHGKPCDEPLCFEPGEHFWWDAEREDEEPNRRSCTRHYAVVLREERA
jgi:hypothetical protein